MSSHNLRAKDYLLHMIEAADRILAYAADTEEAGFLSNPMLQDAVIRNIEVIGEAANNLVISSPDLVQRHPSVPFAQIYAMRNRIAHGYFAVSLRMVWETVRTDVPQLRERLAQIAAELPDSP